MKTLDIWQYITSIRGKIYTLRQEPFIKLITVYTKDGRVTDVGITSKPERTRKARRAGLNEERQIKRIDEEVKIENPGKYDIQHGKFMLIYKLQDEDLEIFKVN